jgi:branched-chain amino acid aminotransferase
MTIEVCIDGEIRGEADAKVSVFDRGFLYGDSVFEVMRTYGGVPFAQSEHLARLRISAQKILIPMEFADAVLIDEIARTLDAADNDESYVRVMVTRGSGPLSYDPNTARDPLRIVIVTPLSLPPTEVYEKGVPVVCVRQPRATESGPQAGTKASNYLANLLAAHEARQKGGYEAILLGADGAVLEGTTSNVFVVDGERVRTPRLESGILAGITRATVLHVAEEAGLSVEETVLFPRDLYDADEVFITSSIREVVPVVRVDGRPIAGGAVGPMTRRLHAAFRGYVMRDLTRPSPSAK